MSYAFDRYRVDKDRFHANASASTHEGADGFCKQSEERIFRETKFTVKIVQKHHSFFFRRLSTLLMDGRNTVDVNTRGVDGRGVIDGLQISGTMSEPQNHLVAGVLFSWR